ncbi:MAG: phosphatidate cytidylyltransferase [Treponema sp.]|nr:phosphatidate cytidylyltransferase [Treponema sp.]
MNVKKIIERLIIFFVGLPAVTAIVMFLPWYQNLAMNIAATFLSGVGAMELSSMLKKKNINVTKVESFILGILAPLAITLYVSFNFPNWITASFLMAGAGWGLLSGIFARRKSEMENTLNRVVGCFALLIYPGFFIYWLIRMNIWGDSFIILLFLLMAFSSDSIAWFFGTILGKNNRGIIAVSPNKSIAGFIGGILGPILVACAAAYFFPDTFYQASGSAFSSLLFPAILIGFCTGLAAIWGDLAESAIKRSCDFKDSGNFMLGRGGVLDSLDSIAAAAPVFYVLYYLFFINT